MEKKNGVSGLLIIVVFAIMCFMVYFVAIYKKAEYIVDDSDKIIINDSFKSDITSTIDKYLTNIFMEHSAKYCGELNYDDEYESDADSLVTYYRMKNYDSLLEVKKVFSSIVSGKFFDEKLAGKFVENNGNVYCGLIPRDSLIYAGGTVTLISVEENNDILSVKGYYETEETDMGPSNTFNFEVSMVKNNNIWVIDTYEER